MIIDSQMAQKEKCRILLEYMDVKANRASGVMGLSRGLFSEVEAPIFARRAKYNSNIDQRKEGINGRY